MNNNTEITGVPFGFRNFAGGPVVKWGVRIRQGVGATGDVVRIITKHGVVRRGILGRLQTSFTDKTDGEHYNAWGLQQPEGHEERHPIV